MIYEACTLLSRISVVPHLHLMYEGTMAHEGIVMHEGVPGTQGDYDA